MKALVYGAGNIGRGFVGVLFSQAGYSVTFVDVDREVVERLCRERRYPVRIVSDEAHTDIEIRDVDAVDGRDMERVAQLIAETDLMATAVGAKALPLITPHLAAGLRLRRTLNRPPLNILLCENLNDVNKVMETLIQDQLTAEEADILDEGVGLVETSIGRMVPVQTLKMQDGDPLRVCVESYGFLPVDRDAFRGEIPSIPGMVPFSPFDFYIKRKLFVHNMGHATCAYLGLYTGKQYIWEAIADSRIALATQNAMLESAVALSSKYDVSLPSLIDHIHDLISRFSNRALEDTCARVAADPARKLAPSDRLIGAVNVCRDQGVFPAYVSLATAGAIHTYLRELDADRRDEADVATFIAEHCHVAPNGASGELILNLVERFASGNTLEQMMGDTARIRRSSLGDII